jgi:hypothetical protein
MTVVVGPVLTREGGYAFDVWMPGSGVCRGFAYRRVEDAYYARNVEINSDRPGAGLGPVVCRTLDEFVYEIAERSSAARDTSARPLKSAA